MKTEKQREDDFRRDFSALLKKHGAQIQITDDEGMSHLDDVPVRRR